MGNTPSTNAGRTPNSPSSSSSPSSRQHEPQRSGTGSTRRDPRNLIQSQAQRTNAKAEPSSVQAHTINATHRTRNSISSPTYRNRPSPSQSLESPTGPSNSAAMSTPVAQKSKEAARRPDARDQPSKPVDVPTAPANNADSSSLPSHSMSLEPSGPPHPLDMSYHLTRPPRLPLPIEEEVHTPGSPIIAPADLETDAPILDISALDDENEILARKTSGFSNNTGDDDEEDAEELTVDKTKASVPIPFEWKEGGDRVYVTGTIFEWNKKHRLHPVEGEPNLLRAIIHVLPGTHHVRFIVDGNMTCSSNLPTTVDFGNNLVNYIEVSSDDLPRETAPQPREDGLPVETATEHEAETQRVEEAGEAALVLPRTKKPIPVDKFTSHIPQYLVDLDKAEDSIEYRYAAAAIEKLPPPPSLPGFLGKPILNMATPMKDDNSVLLMPNHTVLNHLATSSIKHNVLAVSATTRYKKKYVTTIMYKPTGVD